MLVVADSSAIVALINIQLFALLNALFQEVAVPPAVAEELASPLRPPAVREMIAHPPEWLKVVTPSRIEHILRIHRGEMEAINLAQELGADLLLIDDREGRRAAISRNIRTARTIAILGAGGRGWADRSRGSLSPTAQHRLSRLGCTDEPNPGPSPSAAERLRAAAGLRRMADRPWLRPRGAGRWPS